MEPVLLRLTQPALPVPAELAAQLLKAGIAEEAKPYRTKDPIEPEAMIRFKRSMSALGSYFCRGEIAGCKKEDADWYIGKGFAELVSKPDRDAHCERARQESEKNLANPGLEYFEFLVSWAVHGSYYRVGEIAAWSGERARFVREARMQSGDPFVRQLTQEEVKALEARLEADRTKASAGIDDSLVLVRFLISTQTAGGYYNHGEVAGFSRTGAAEILSMRTRDNRPFAELVEGDVPPARPEAPPDLPEDGEVIGLETQADAERNAEEAKSLDRPPKNRMVDQTRRK